MAAGCLDVVHWVKDWKAESPPKSYTKTLFSSVSFPANKSPAVYWRLAFESSVGPQKIKLRLLLPKKQRRQSQRPAQQNSRSELRFNIRLSVRQPLRIVCV